MPHEELPIHPGRLAFGLRQVDVGRPMARDCRKIGIHRDTVRRYIGAESPPTRRSRATPTTLISDTITD